MRIGIDLGGTKIEGIALDGRRELARARTSTPKDDYDGTVRAIAGMVGELERRAGGRGTVGIGIPGTIAPGSALVKNANSTWLIGRPFQTDVEAALGRPVRVANDANCFTVSEAADGAATGAVVVFGVILGTGTGGGIVIGGRALEGANAIAGEWGHNPLPWPDVDEYPGPGCYCGKRGCIETFLSGPGLAADHFLRTGTEASPEEIVRLADEGDMGSRQTLDRYERRLARALASVINVLDPDVVVLGGGVSRIARLYQTVPRLWPSWIFSAGDHGPVRTRLVAAAHGAESGVRGAAWLWADA